MNLTRHIAFAKADAVKSGGNPQPVTAPAPVLPGGTGTAPAPVLPEQTPDEKLGSQPGVNPGEVGTTASVQANSSSGGSTGALNAGKREAPTLTDIVDDFVKPAKVAKPTARGGKAQYPFESLAVGQSFGVMNKTFKNVNSTVASCNKRQPKVAQTNADGSARMVEVDMPGGGKAQAQAMGPAKVFSAAVVPAGTYGGKEWPEHVRVWRDA